jgi:hypothetical protein
MRTKCGRPRRSKTSCVRTNIKILIKIQEDSQRLAHTHTKNKRILPLIFLFHSDEVQEYTVLVSVDYSLFKTSLRARHTDGNKALLVQRSLLYGDLGSHPTLKT